MTETLAPLEEISELTVKLAEALNRLAHAKADRDHKVREAAEATEHYKELFDLVKAVQREINNSITVCLNLQGQ